MDPLKLILISIGLAADAFAVSVAEGVVVRENLHGHTARVSAMFGAFQGLMPILGWLAGGALRAMVAAVDGWVAFGLLAIVGGKMLLDAATGFESAVQRPASTTARLLVLAVATSIDAFAVGLSLAMLRVSIWAPAVVIALVTAAMSAAGVQAGNRVGAWVGRRAELVGGIVLLAIAVKILLEHIAR